MLLAEQGVPWEPLWQRVGEVVMAALFAAQVRGWVLAAVVMAVAWEARRTVEQWGGWWWWWCVCVCGRV